MNFHREKLAQFKNAYSDAVKDGKTEFTFEKHSFYAPYARYLIMYLEDVLKD